MFVQDRDRIKTELDGVEWSVTYDLLVVVCLPAAQGISHVSHDTENGVKTCLIGVVVCLQAALRVQLSVNAGNVSLWPHNMLRYH